MSSRGNYARQFGFTPIGYKPKQRGRPRIYAGPKTRTGKNPRNTGGTIAPSAAPRMGQRVRYGSATLTKTRTKQNKVYMRPGIPGSTSYFNYGQKSKSIAKSLYKEFLGRQTATSQTPSQLQSATYGRQAIAGGFETALLTRDDITLMRDTVAGAAFATDPKTYKWFLQDCKSVFHITNQGTRPIKMRIFDIMCKSNIHQTGLDTPLEAWKAGLDNETLDSTPPSGGVTTDKHLLVGQYPKTSPEFNRYYQICNVTTVDLDAASFHEHRVTLKHNKMISSVNVDNMANQGRSVGKYTYFCMIVAYGTLVNDATGTSVATVTYDKVYLDIINNQTFRYGWLENQKPLMTVRSELIAAAPVGGLHGAVDLDNVIQVVSAGAI